MPWTIQERVYFVEKYLQTGSFAKANSAYRRDYGVRKFPSKSMVQFWVRKFRKGSLENKKRKTEAGEIKSGRRKDVRSRDNIERVSQSVGQSPKTSVRRRGQELGINRESVRRILVQDLNLHPYRISIRQTLSDRDIEQRVTMANWFKQRVENEPDFLDNIWFSDEAHFMLSGHVNSKNNVFWGVARPDEVLQRPLHSQKCTTWCAISKHGVIGPIWIEDQDGCTTTVNTQRYISVLQQFWRILGRRAGVNRAAQWFQQDGATPHTSRESLNWLRDHFEDRVISNRLPIVWAPHSPDLNPADFYLWGYLKDNVYTERPDTIEDLKAAITAQIRRITKEECQRVIDNFERRIQICLERNGRHLEHVL